MDRFSIRKKVFAYHRSYSENLIQIAAFLENGLAQLLSFRDKVDKLGEPRSRHLLPDRSDTN